MNHRVLFVCLGNICRSPTAEGVLLHLLIERGITTVTVDSAGTSAYHIGEGADKRSKRSAEQRGIILPSRARQFVVQDFDRFDLILAMDQSNVQNILGLARTEFDRRKVMLFRSFDPLSDEGASVPDPYYENNFELVLDICEAGCRGLLEKMVSNPFY
jgi:protein-tyrosine phosphatase